MHKRWGEGVKGSKRMELKVDEVSTGFRKTRYRNDTSPLPHG